MPIGPATSIAIAVIRSVPANSGTAPKAPDEPTWSARSAVCGLHCRPNRNSVIGTFWKNRINSNSDREDDPGGRGDRDAGGQPQGDGHPALDQVARAEVALDVAQGRRQAEDRQGDAGDEQGDPAEGRAACRSSSAAACMAGVISPAGGRPSAMRRTALMKKLTLSGLWPDTSGGNGAQDDDCAAPSARTGARPPTAPGRGRPPSGPRRRRSSRAASAAPTSARPRSPWHGGWPGNRRRWRRSG